VLYCSGVGAFSSVLIGFPLRSLEWVYAFVTRRYAGRRAPEPPVPACTLIGFAALLVNAATLYVCDAADGVSKASAARAPPTGVVVTPPICAQPMTVESRSRTMVAVVELFVPCTIGEKNSTLTLVPSKVTALPVMTVVAVASVLAEIAPELAVICLKSHSYAGGFDQEPSP